MTNQLLRGEIDKDRYVDIYIYKHLYKSRPTTDKGFKFRQTTFVNCPSYDHKVFIAGDVQPHCWSMSSSPVSLRQSMMQSRFSKFRSEFSRWKPGPGFFLDLSDHLLSPAIGDPNPLQLIRSETITSQY